jgi:hypothetical protein
MPRLALDDTVVAQFAEQSRFNVLWDTSLWGFGCRLSTRPPPRYFVYFRTRVMGAGCRYTIGSSLHMSCSQARRIAQEFIARSAPHQLSRRPGLPGQSKL